MYTRVPVNVAGKMGIKNFQVTGVGNRNLKQTQHIGSQKITDFVFRNS
jgi:hypothetical protein